MTEKELEELEELSQKIEEAYSLSDNQIQSCIDSMLTIYIDKNSTQHEKQLAFNTILDGLSPFLTQEEIKLLAL